MKLLVFTTQFHRSGGAENLAIALVNELNQRSGVVAHLLGLYSERDPAVRDARNALENRGIPKVHLLGLPLHPSPWALVRALARFRSILRRERFDAVETSLAGPTILAAIGLKGTSVPHLIGFHCSVDEDNRHSVRMRLLARILNGRKHEKYYGISGHTMRTWIDYARLPAMKACVIHNGIPDAFFDATNGCVDIRSLYGISAKSRVALFIGRMIRAKGIFEVVRALGPILYSNDLHLVMIGDLDESVKNSDSDVQMLRREIAENGWAERIHFLGFKENVIPYMRVADVLVHPPYAEGFGLVLAEALAIGTPIVASDVGGIAEVVANTATILVPPRDVPRIQQAVLKVMARTDTQKLRAAGASKKRADAFRSTNRAIRILECLEEMKRG